MQAEVNVEHRFEWGLQLPNGTEIWAPDTFHERSVATPEDRKIIVDALGHSSQNLGFGESPLLLDQYRWISREVQVITIERNLNDTFFGLNDPAAVRDLSTTDQTDHYHTLDEDDDLEVMDTDLRGV